MTNKTMTALGNKRSVIRELFEFGNKRRAEIGAENVFDYSLGNPSIPSPDEVTKAIISLAENESPISLHGYTSAPGDTSVRKAIADHINRKYNANVTFNDVYMTVGAAASLTISINAVTNKDDEIVIFAPFFPEYRVFIESAGRKAVPVLLDMNSFQIDFDALEKAINEKTAAVVINSPNNPTGTVLTAETVNKLASFLKAKEKEYGHLIYLISDEPYREIVYDTEEMPYITNCYNNSLVCYSYSKSLSLPGERIGYILVSPTCDDKDTFAAVAGAGRALGFVCAPSLWQKVAAKCVDLTSDLSLYRKNRDYIYNALTQMGYEVIEPKGAFYLFVKTPKNDANAFSERAKNYELLLVPSDDFGVPGYIRIAYCVSYEQIEKSLPAFKKLIDSYK